MLEFATAAALRAHYAAIRQRLYPPPVPAPWPSRIVTPPEPAKVAAPAPRLVFLAAIEEVAPPHIHSVILVIRAAAKHFGVTATEICSKRRQASIVYPRQIAMHVACMMTRHSMPEIGRRLGGRDHTTVLHGNRKIARLAAGDERIAADVEAVSDIAMHLQNGGRIG